MPASRIASELRRQIFQTLVEVQDRGQSVHRSRVLVAAQFGVTCQQVKHIEDEGLEWEWPPLSEPDLDHAGQAVAEAEPADESLPLSATVAVNPIEIHACAETGPRFQGSFNLVARPDNGVLSLPRVE